MDLAQASRSVHSFRANGRGAVTAQPASAARRSPRAPLATAPAAQMAGAEVAFAAFERYVLDLQERILSDAEALDGSGKAFVRDRWSRGSESAGERCSCAAACGAQNASSRRPSPLPPPAC